jgi:uncharacterized phage protein (TIGR02218 family)
MKPLSAALRSLLATRQFYTADLYTLSLVDGTALRYCGGDRDITWNGSRFAAGGQTGPYFDRSSSKAKCRWRIGVEVDQLVLDVLPGSAAIAGLPFLSAARQGALDGAELTLERAFMPSWGDVSAGTVVMFAGRIAEIEAGRSVATLTVNSHLELLNLNLPRNLYMPGCVNTLGDASCGVNLAAFAVATTVLELGTPDQVVFETLPYASGYFDLGKVAFAGGALAGVSRSVKAYLNIAGLCYAYLTAPLPVQPAVGDAVTLYPGCDKTPTGANGCAKFANQARFRGFPFVPVPETAV